MTEISEILKDSGADRIFRNHRVNKEFKRRTKAMEITGGEMTTYRLLANVALTMNFSWRKYALSAPRHFYTLKVA